MPETPPPHEPTIIPSTEPRPLKSLETIRDDVRTIRREATIHPEFSTNAIHWTNQIAVLTKAFQQGELPAQEFNALVGTLLAEKETAAERDPLTDLYRRDAFLDKSSAFLALSRRNEQPASLAYIDLDGFKSINDVHGHHAGDAVLQQVSGFLQSEVREHDVLGRLGGEEFGLLLPFTSEEKAHDVLERLRERMPESVSEALIGMGFVIPERITMSVGVAPAHFVGNPKEKLPDSVLTDLIKEADKRAYIAKEQGKNQVVSTKNLPPKQT
jgi:diguanylate cyclase (GGDEF)-like protein